MYQMNVLVSWISPLNQAVYGKHNFGYDALLPPPSGSPACFSCFFLCFLLFLPFLKCENTSLNFLEKRHELQKGGQ